MKLIQFFIFPVVAFSFISCANSEEKPTPSTSESVACGPNNPCPQGKMGRRGGKGPMGQRPQFSDIDKDGDGKITSKELDEFRAKRMERLASEGKSLRNAKNAPKFEVLDKNKDGVLTSDEYPLPRPGRRGGRGR